MEQRAQVVAQRQRDHQPWHALEHRVSEDQTYIITGTCYQHSSLMHHEARRLEWQEKLLDLLEDLQATTFAWCVLPNHYHLLARLDLLAFGKSIGRLHNGTSTQWNREDGAPKRKVWHSHCDRTIRSERHFYASLNYIHANPVKHGYARRAPQWPTSSVHHYLEIWGRESLRQVWNDYPVLDYGKGWDW